MKNVADKDMLMKIKFKDLLLIQILSSLSTFIGPFIDGIIVSDFLGSAHMAAFGIIAPVTILVGAVANIFNAGSQNVAGKYMGQGKSDKLNGLMTGTVAWATGVGVVIAVLVCVFCNPIVRLLGAEGETVKICTDYITMYAPGIIPTILMPTFVGYLQLDNGGKTAVAASAAMTVTDIIFDLLAVLVFKNGMRGIGLATTISYVLAVLILLTHFLKKSSTLKFALKESQVNDVKKIIICGLPAATFLLCNAVRVSATNNIILDVSDLNSVAAFSIQNTFRPLTLAFTLGTGITALLVCSVISGEENRHSLRKELTYILKVGIIIAISLTAVILICAKYPFAKMFCVGQPEEFTGLVAHVIRMFAISIPFSMLNIIFIYYYQSMRKLLLSTLITVAQNVLYYLLAAKILSVFMGVDGIWLGYIISELLTFLTICIFTWIKCGHFPKSVHDFMLLPDSFGVDADNRMTITVVKEDEAVKISEKICEFCKNKGIDSRRSMAAGLCTEELAVISLQNSDASKAYVDIFLTYKNGDLNIRMMDNCRPLDKKILAGMAEEYDPAAHAGIRIIKGLAKDITYNVVLGMNAYSMVL